MEMDVVNILAAPVQQLVSLGGYSDRITPILQQHDVTKPPALHSQFSQFHGPCE